MSCLKDFQLLKELTIVAYMISSKTVVFKSHFYEVNDKKRAYYSSSTGGGDYIRYITTGINETKEFDYLQHN